MGALTVVHVREVLILVVMAALSTEACRSGLPGLPGPPGRHPISNGTILELGPKLYSQHDEELLVRHFFDDERGGTFVDVGCWDWREGSTTLYLEERLDWSGLAVDAQPQLEAGYTLNRPRTRFLNYLVTDHSGEVGHLYLADQISSTDRDHAAKFWAQWYQEKPLEVPTITLDDLLARNGLARIDLLSMDIEGSEPKALAGFDIERYRPRLVVIEVTPDTRASIAEYFAAHAYERVDAYLAYDEVNWYFQPAKHRRAP